MIETVASKPALTEFKEGLQLLRNGHAASAYEYFRRATESEQQNPYYLSFLGVSVSRARLKWADAVVLCETALSLKRNEAQLYLNLAEVHVSAGRRDDALAVLERGLIYCKADPRIRRARGKLGRRRSPVLPFLEREHFLNRSLGKLRHRVLLWVQRSDHHWAESLEVGAKSR
jgi:Flp pilus assembly protein TadD